MRTAHFLKSVCLEIGSVASSVTLLINWLASNQGTKISPRPITCTAHQRRAFWGWVFRGAPRAAWNRGAEREAATAIKQALAEGRAPETDRAGLLSLIDAGAGQSDLMTLRAVARLQEADVIFLSGDLPQDLLELARRDAERVILPAPGTGTAFPLDGFEPALLAEARAGRRVVRLCGAADYAHLSGLPAPSGCDLEQIPGVALAEAPDNQARTPGRAAPLR